MRIIGLTGGIASGKSTVARYLRTLGAHVIDADQLARDVVEPGEPALEEIVSRFGSAVLAANGTLDRAALSKLVFGDRAARADLNRIVHPRIATASQARMAELAASGVETVIYEAALIVESKLYTWMHALIVVALPRELQLQRLMERDNLSLQEAEQRLAAQASLEDKLSVADYIVDNAGTPAHTERQVVTIWRQIHSIGEASSPS